MLLRFLRVGSKPSGRVEVLITLHRSVVIAKDPVRAGERGNPLRETEKYE